MREIAFGVLLVVSAALVVVGVAGWSADAATVLAGVLLAGLGWAFLGNV